MTDYTDWTREKMIEHLTAYSAGIHQLANTVMEQRYKISRLEKRIVWITQVRGWLHGAA